MNSKKIIAGLLSFVIAATTTATPLSGTISGVLDNFSLSASAETSGDYEYSILDDGTVEITKYKGSDIEVEIPSDIDNKKVTSIGNFAFSNYRYFKSVTIPEGVTNIGKGAFSSCQYLANVTIPEGVKTIGVDAFRECPSLTTITLPNGVTSIGGNAFYSCTSLTDITIPDSVTDFGSQVFDGTKWLENKQKENPLVIINNILIDGKNSEGIVVIPDGVIKIVDNAFGGCGNLTSVVIPNSVTSIEDYAFISCSNLKSITIPNSITNIPQYTFTFCQNLKTVYYFGTEEEWNNITIEDSYCPLIKAQKYYNMGDYESKDLDNETVEITKYNGSAAELEIPPEINGKKVTSIGESAFEKCTSLKNVIIPEGVTDIGFSSFYLCTNLTNVTIPNGVTSIGSNAFAQCTNLTNVTIPDSVTNLGERAFIVCSSLKSITIPGSIKTIKNNTFYSCHNLTNLIISDGVTSIEDQAFVYCDTLTYVTIPRSVTSIGSRVFDAWSSNYIKSVYYFGTKEEWNKIEIADSNDPLINARKYFNIGDYESKVLDDGTVEITGYNGSASEVDIPPEIDGKKVTSIGESAFSDCQKLKCVTIPEGVTNIGKSAFNNTTSLLKIILPNTVKTISSSAFDTTYLKYVYFIGTEEEWSSIEIGDNNDKLKSASVYYGINDYYYKNLDDGTLEIIGYYGSDATIEIPSEINGKKVTIIGVSAFSDCTSLINVTIPNSVTLIKDSAFYACRNLKSVIIPDSVTEIEGMAFAWCDKLVSVKIPDGITKVQGYAFSVCTSLESITLPSSIKTIEHGAFLMPSTKLKSVYFSGSEEEWKNISIKDSNDPVIIAHKYYSIGDYESKVLDDGTVEITGYNGSASNVDIPPEIDGKKVTSIGEEAFKSCTSITCLTIPDGVTNIGKNAFYYCTNLAKITLTNNVKTISSSAFDMTYLNYVNFIGTEEEWNSIEIGDNNDKLKSATVYYGINDYYYKNLDDGTLEIVGYYGSDTRIKIPSEINGKKVTSIGSSAFKNCSRLDNVTIPNGITSIGDYSFANCSGITSVEIPASVTSIGKGAFEDCSSLVYLGLQKGITSIEERAFGNCSALRAIELPDSVISIGDIAFWNCSNLTEVFIPHSVESIEGNPFVQCSNITSIEVDQNNKNYSSKDDVLFNKDQTELLIYPCGNEQTSYSVPDSVTSIGSSAFEECKNLTHIVIRENVETIKDYAFVCCENLKSITIPESVTSIEEGAFDECSNLNTVYYSGSQEKWNNIEIADYNDPLINAHKYYNLNNYETQVLDDGTIEITNYNGSETELEIPPEIDGQKVTRIGDWIFSNCKSLTSVTIPDSVTSIGESPFGDCENLTDITVDENNVNYSSSDGVLFNKDKTTLIQYPAGNKRTSYTIPNSVTNIENFAFYKCTKLTSITIPNSVTSIGKSAFHNCSSLKNVTIPNGVTSIKDYSFADCSSLSTVEIPGSVIGIGNNAFENCSSLVDLRLQKGVTSIGKIAFGNCSSLQAIEIPDSVISIGDNAFWNCSNLTEVFIPYSVETIGIAPFVQCSNLTSIEVDSNNKNYSSKDDVLFNKDQTELLIYPCGNEQTSYSVPDSVRSIGSFAFAYCNNFTHIVITENVETIKEGAFMCCENLKSIKIPDSVTSIGSFAFEECKNLTHIVITGNVETIKDHAFACCENLKSITIPESVTSIEEGAFDECSNLNTVYYSGTEDEWNNIEIDVYNDALVAAYKYYNMSRSVLHQKKLDNTAVRFLYLADIDDVTKATSANVTFKGDRTAVGTESITKAYRSIIAGGKKVTAPEGKCYLVTSPMYLNEVSSEWAAEFALYEDDAVTKQSQGICKIG